MDPGSSSEGWERPPSAHAHACSGSDLPCDAGSWFGGTCVTAEAALIAKFLLENVIQQEAPGLRLEWKLPPALKDRDTAPEAEST